jgi:hypothetical protein
MSELNSYLKRTYGVTESEYETLQIVQGGLCAVCRRTNPSRNGEEPERLAVDHDHLSGQNRGLLCQNCNRILGFIEGKSGCPVEQSTECLFRFLIYLREHNQGAIPFSPVSSVSEQAKFLLVRDPYDET